jgi:mannose-1-phosphate guanylyltransferase/phosphomannomutase
MDKIKDLSTIIVRGRIQCVGNKELTPELAAKIGAAFGSYYKTQGIIVVSREYNNNNRMLKRAFIGGLMSAGINILNLHSASVPVLQFCIRRFGATGGVYFSSFSSGELQNQILFYDSSGIEFERNHLDSINEYFKNNRIYRAPPLEVGSISDIPHTQDIYKKAIPKFFNQKLISKNNLHIVVDCSYGPSAISLPSILTEMKSIDVIAINAYENDQKSIEGLPTIDTVKDVINIVKASHSDLGVIVDKAGTRALYIDETGHILSYEELMMFFIKYDKFIAKSKESPIFIVESASKVLEEYITKTAKFRIIKTKNFPGQISRGLKDERGVFGGADTLKFYFPEYGPFSDTTFTILKIIEIISREKLPLSTLIRAFPRHVHAYKSLPSTKEKMNHFQQHLMEKVQFDNAHDWDYQDTIMGVKIIIHNEGWVSIQPSIHTETIELVAEAKNPENSEMLITKIEEFIQSLL